MPELLHGLNCSLVISTYQAGKVVFISAIDDRKLIQLPRNFRKPMGLALNEKQFAVASHDQIVIFANAPRMAKTFPQQPNTYDALFLPRKIHFTGPTEIHDLNWVDNTLWAVNTRFSCLAVVDDHYSFIPKWKPFFIEELKPNDQCHLNGVAFQNEIPRFVTALGKTDSPEGWRAEKLTGGILMDVARNVIVADELAMPHSPRIFDERLLVLLSATGELAEVDRDSGKVNVLKSLNGFVRGMDRAGEYVFVGLSKIRTSSSSFRDLPIAERSLFAGIAVLHLPSNNLVGHIRYENSVEEIYDVKVLPGIKRPGIVPHDREGTTAAITTPDGDYWAITKE